MRYDDNWNDEKLVEFVHGEVIDGKCVVCKQRSGEWGATKWQEWSYKERSTNLYFLAYKDYCEQTTYGQFDENEHFQAILSEKKTTHMRSEKKRETFRLNSFGFLL